MNRNKLMVCGLIAVIAILSVGMVMGAPDSKKVDTKLKIKFDSPLHEGDIIKFKLTDAKKAPISNKTLNVRITDENGKSDYYSVVTSQYGNGKLKLDKGAGEYVVKCRFAGDKNYTLSKKIQKITVEEEEEDYYDSGAFYSEQAGRTIYTGEVQEGPDGCWYEHVGNNEWVRVG